VTMNISGLPHANHVTSAFCDDPRCRAVHLVLVREDGTPFAVALLDADQLEQMAGQARDMAYAKVVLRGEEE